MRKYLFFVLASLEMLVTAIETHANENGRFIAFVCANTKDGSAGGSFQMNMNIVESAVAQYASLIDLPLRKIRISNEEFSYPSIRDIIKRENITKKDIVFFYITCHGSMSVHDSSEFPLLYMLNDSVIQSESIHNYILNVKKPKFLLTVIDACNSKVNVTKEQVLFFHGNRFKPSDSELTGSIKSSIQKLFRQYKGDIILTAVQRKQNAIGTMEFGGVFTNSFVNEVLRGSNSIWIPSDIWSYTLDNIKNRSMNDSKFLAESNNFQSEEKEWMPVWRKNVEMLAISEMPSFKAYPVIGIVSSPMRDYLRLRMYVRYVNSPRNDEFKNIDSIQYVISESSFSAAKVITQLHSFDSAIECRKEYPALFPVVKAKIYSRGKRNPEIVTLYNVFHTKMDDVGPELKGANSQ